jgi:hypothetical protein
MPDERVLDASRRKETGHRERRRKFGRHAMTANAHQDSSKATLFGIVLMWAIAQASVFVVHEFRISCEGFHNPAGERCCRDHDCESPEQVAVTGKGWVVGGTELVPFDEATPSPDGKLWICRRPDRMRRCVFGPPRGSQPVHALEGADQRRQVG